MYYCINLIDDGGISINTFNYCTWYTISDAFNGNTTVRRPDYITSYITVITSKSFF